MIHCNCKIVSKEGFHKGVQRYKCAGCGKRFTGSNRLSTSQIWQEYVQGKQTYKQLATKYGYSTKTIQRRIDAVLTKRHTPFPAVANVLMDTTYFSRGGRRNGVQRQHQWQDFI